VKASRREGVVTGAFLISPDHVNSHSIERMACPLSRISARISEAASNAGAEKESVRMDGSGGTQGELKRIPVREL